MTQKVDTDLQSGASIPSWLETPPVSEIDPPVDTRLQELPLEKLKWEDFERLCLRLVRLEANVEHCQLYGEPGQKQEGIDLYARQKFAEKYRVYQCKRVQGFGPAKIINAASDFLAGEWANKTDTFVLCTTESLRSKERADELENQSTLLRERGITLLPWDSIELSIKLKSLPKLVDDFFGRGWVAAFCGVEEAGKLDKKLDASKVIEFRKKFAEFYRRVFNTHDPGLPIVTLGEVSSLALEERYVFPDVYDWRSIAISPPAEIKESQISREEMKQIAFGDTGLEGEQQTVRSKRPRIAYQQRQIVGSWLAVAERSVVLGGPGSGKSTLLRFIAIDLLEESPRLTLLSQKWGQFLPVWVPFALWTKMISNQTTAACSLSEILYSWLKSWDEERLWPLVQKVLEDERLLLLVDGLDEWTNESAARVALDRLLVFIGQRNTPAIITSRPHGFNRLGMQISGWRLGDLSDFSTTQQKQLLQIWFFHTLRNIYKDLAVAEVERKANAETEDFFTELQRSPDLRELSKVPLLLCLLIYHRIHNARLPQSRFKAYDSLIEHLISVHPQRRRAAALLSDASSELTDDDVKRILAHLGYHMQQQFEEGLIDHDKAGSIVEEYLKDCERGFGFQPPEAHRYSREVLEVSENTIGILVRRSPTEIGFFHRAFQEYLASYHLSRMSLAEQLSVIETRFADPQWREIILGLFQITSRAEDIKQFIACIKKKTGIAGLVERQAIELLFCETAFGDFNCPVNLARELAQETFEQVELGTWMPHRERLLQGILDGLRSTKMKEIIREKLKDWFPCRAKWRESIFTAMGSWPLLPEVVKCLWKGIHDEETINQRAAARALGDLAKSDSETGNLIASLARNAIDPKIRAAAVEALLRGWPDHEAIDGILNNARLSMSPELRLVSIVGRIQRQTQTEEDQDELIRLGSWEAGLDYHWRDDVASALMNGWPQSPKTKNACFKALRERIQDRKQLEIELATRILLQGYPQDEDVTNFCVNNIKYEKYPFLLLHRPDPWHLLSQNFRDNPPLVEAIDEWIPNQQYQEPEISRAAMVGRTPKAKAKLISSLNSSFPFWAAEALIEGWGMEDGEVAEKLMEFASGPASKASRIGFLLPQIIKDKAICRNRLLELLRDPECSRPDFIMKGLRVLGDTQGDVEVVDTVLKLLPDRERWRNWNVIEWLILGYSSDQRVKDIAKQEFSRRDGCYGAIASAYGNDDEVRQKIIDIACPLPVPLRGMIAASLGENTSDTEFTLSLLQLYDLEQDEEVKTQASIGYHTRLKESGKDIKSVIDTLSKSIVCYGHDYEERRQAAFCGLVILDRLDIMKNAKETIGDDRQCAIAIIKGLSPNVPLLKHILQNWDDIKAALADEFWPRLSKFHSDPLYIWNELCLFADQYPSPRNEALSFLEVRTERTSKPNILRFLGRVRPKSHLLLEYCLKALHIGDDQQDSSGEEAVVAAELLGSNYAGDGDILAHIMTEKVRKRIYNKVILALCEGWPESEELSLIFEIVADKKVPLFYPAYFQLICRKSESRVVFDAITKELSSFNYTHQFSLQAIYRPVIRRLQMDDSLLRMLTERLKDNPTASEKATIPRLIGTARGVTPELRSWSIKELNRQLIATQSPEVGVDLIMGELRPVVHSLLDVLNQPIWRES
jgi:energy-coupling factor transporter ATP-binding protein EcfA2